MTFDERVHAVEQEGFTERQARFLTTVMLHAGVCVPRQYARFCGIVYGAKTRKFFDKLVRLRYPDELLVATTLPEQGRLLGQWVLDAFEALALEPPVA